VFLVRVAQLLSVRRRFMSWFARLFRKKAEPVGFVGFDFTQTFPHVFWLSTVAKDNRSPEGFRYKVLTARHEPEMKIELVVLRESLDGEKTKVIHMEAPLEKFGATDDMIRQLGEDSSVTFERFDMSGLRTFDDFKSRAIEVGWGYYEP
jgi:hypothetical protein